jgi:hypothetical protein
LDMKEGAVLRAPDPDSLELRWARRLGRRVRRRRVGCLGKNDARSPERKAAHGRLLTEGCSRKAAHGRLLTEGRCPKAAYGRLDRMKPGWM